MDTVTKPAQPPRATDRLLQALSTVAALLDRSINEVKTLDSDFQNRVLEAVHETESSLQQQAAEHLQAALEEVRNEMRTSFDHDMTKAVENVRGELTEETQKLSAEVQRAAQSALEWET